MREHKTNDILGILIGGGYKLLNKRLKKIVAVLLSLLMMMSLSGCKTDKDNHDKDGCLELVNSPSTTLDNVWYNPGGIFRCAVFESLLTVSADMNDIEYNLANKYEVSIDELTYTFTLREDVKWHDGEKFDAEDVLFSVKMALRVDEVNGILSAALYSIEGAEDYGEGLSDELSGVIVDGNQITFKLSAQNGHFIEAMAQFAILPEHLLGGVEPLELASNDYWKNPIGCGCYKITEAVEGEYFMLEAFEDYYGEEPGVYRMKIRLNEEAPVTAIKEGRLDFYITNDPEEIAELKGIENCSEHYLNIMFPTYLIVNLTDDEGVNTQLQDVRVREALLLAIDRDTMVEAIFPGSSVTDTLVPDWSDWYLADGKDYSYNPDRARELLEEAGYDFSQPIRLRYSTKGQATKDLMEAIAVYWRAIGLSVSVEKFDGSGSEHMFNIRDYDVCYKRLSAFNYASIYDEVYGTGVMQTKVFNQPVYDELCDELSITMDTEVRKSIIKEMQELDQEYLLRIPLFSLANVAYVNDSRFSMPECYGNLWYRYDLCFEKWKLVD